MPKPKPANLTVTACLIRPMSEIRKRSITLAGHRTSYSVEDRFQEILAHMAKEQSVPLATLIAGIDAARGNRANLSSALRLAVLAYLETKAGQPAGSVNSA